MRLITALALAVFFSTAQAQSYPNRPITMVVPFPPGGIADITGRPFGAVMSRILGQPIVVENKTGAGGAVGHAYAARAKADGYTLLYGTGDATTLLPAVNPKLQYNMPDDLVFITRAFTSPYTERSVNAVIVKLRGGAAGEK